ncbi:Protein of unknown function DUF247, plant [Dillenia turbinata]|uniref:Uncharacterized protein n=1 Tax=Dillenia turbinata TaxID=194707 RepID=A0AAN8ZLT9_9MAGN
MRWFSPTNIPNPSKCTTIRGSFTFPIDDIDIALKNSNEREAGINIKSKTGHLLDIVFEKNVLEIPTIFIYFSTGFVIRNLVAYEQSNRNAQPYFTCLVVFHNNLVDTCEDVSILREAGIVRHAQGSDEDVMKMISSLSRGVVYDESNSYYISDMMEKVYEACHSRWTKIRIKFVRNYAPPLDFLSLLSNNLERFFKLTTMSRLQCKNCQSFLPHPSLPLYSPLFSGILQLCAKGFNETIKNEERRGKKKKRALMASLQHSLQFVEKTILSQFSMWVRLDLTVSLELAVKFEIFL